MKRRSFIKSLAALFVAAPAVAGMNLETKPKRTVTETVIPLSPEKCRQFNDEAVAYIPEVYSQGILTKYYQRNVIDAFLKDGAEQMKKSTDQAVMDSVDWAGGWGGQAR